MHLTEEQVRYRRHGAGGPGHRYPRSGDQLNGHTNEVRALAAVGLLDGRTDAAIELRIRLALVPYEDP